MKGARRDPPEAEVLVQIGINRRQAIVRLATVAAAGAAPAGALAAAAPSEVRSEGKGGAPAAAPSGEGSLAKGSLDPRDPDLVNPVLLWKKILTPEELATSAALCDVILPADERSPAPSKVAVPDFIDEWVSAPYPRQKQDSLVVRGGLAWLNTEANRRFGKRFVALSAGQKTAICDDIADVDKARGRFRAGAKFFDLMRTLTVLGFFTTLEGMKDLGYVGNTPMGEWKGPSDEVLRRLGLTS